MTAITRGDGQFRAARVRPARQGVVRRAGQRGTISTWLGLGLCLVATGGDQAGFPLVALLAPGLSLLALGVARWKPWRAQVWV